MTWHAAGNLGAYAFLGVGPSPEAVSRAGYLVLSESTAFGTQSSLPAVLDEYRGVYQAQEGWRAYAAQGGDAFIACGAELAADALAANGVSVHSYRFDHHSFNSLLPELNSTHTSELPYIFGDPTSYWQVGAEAAHARTNNKAHRSSRPPSHSPHIPSERCANGGLVQRGRRGAFEQHDERMDHLRIHRIAERRYRRRRRGCWPRHGRWGMARVAAIYGGR